MHRSEAQRDARALGIAGRPAGGRVRRRASGSARGSAALIEALALAREWDLVVAGGGDEERYRELADSLGVGGAVHWLGVTRDVERRV